MIRVTATIAVITVLGGCATVQDLLQSWERGAAAHPVAMRERLEPLDRNLFVLESPGQSVIGEPQIVFTNEENTFSDLAREYGLGYDELVAANPDVDPWLPGDETPVLLPTQYVLPDDSRRGLVLNIAAKRLFFFPEVTEGEPAHVLTYPIGIGRVGWQTPLGEAEVVDKARDPSWYVPASVRREHAELDDPLPAVVPPGPDNPLGRFVLQLDMPGYLIHGTNQPYGVGMRVSHGCVRLYPENIETLFELVAIGEPVTIVNEPYLVGYRDGEFYFEGHAPLEDDEIASEQRLEGLFERAADVADATFGQQERDQAESVAAESLGVPVRLSLADADEVFARARLVRNTVEPDPNMPTIDAVRALLDAPPDATD